MASPSKSSKQSKKLSNHSPKLSKLSSDDDFITPIPYVGTKKPTHSLFPSPTSKLLFPKLTPFPQPSKSPSPSKTPPKTPVSKTKTSVSVSKTSSVSTIQTVIQTRDIIRTILHIEATSIGFVINGNTFLVKENIKDAGGHWDRELKQWQFSNGQLDNAYTMVESLYPDTISSTEKEEIAARKAYNYNIKRLRKDFRCNRCGSYNHRRSSCSQLSRSKRNVHDFFHPYMK